MTYDEAAEAMKKHGYTGIGFIIPEGVFFIDKDHIDLNDPIVQKLLKMFPTYAERSFSGDGVHSYGLCDLSRIPVKEGKLNALQGVVGYTVSERIDAVLLDKRAIAGLKVK